MKIIVEIDGKKAERDVKKFTADLFLQNILPNLAKLNPNFDNDAEITAELILELFKSYVHQEIRKYL